MNSPRSHFIALVVLTAGAVLLMITFAAGLGGLGIAEDTKEKERAARKTIVPKTPVMVQVASPGLVEITDAFAGMVRPFERYSLGFEIGGQISYWATSADGSLLDVGDPVSKGQVIARLDERVLRAQLSDAKARLEQAQSELNRAQGLKDRGDRTITEQAYTQALTTLRLSEAAVEMAETRLDDAVLSSPIDGTLSVRKGNVGETVNPQQMIVEVVEVDRVLLMMGVPESRISQIKSGQKVHVELLGRDRYGQKLGWTEGDVYEVSPTADDRTGLFTVEVLIDNQDGRLPPGRVAKGWVVIDCIEGFRLPAHTTVFRDGKTLLFSVDANERAQALPLSRWIDQGPEVILPIDVLPEDHRRVVVRGQHRLTPGREVEIAANAEVTPGGAPVTADEQSAVLRVQPASN